MPPYHNPVLVDEVVSLLQLESNYNVIDATLGGGGHALKFLEVTNPEGKLLGLDTDNEAIAKAAKTLENFADRVILQKTNFQNIYFLF